MSIVAKKYAINYLMIFLAILFKLLLLIWQYQPVFQNITVTPKFKNVSEYQVESKRETLHFSFENNIDEELTLDLEPKESYSYFLDGEEIEPKTSDTQQMTFFLKPKFWGRSHFIVKQVFEYQWLVDLFFVISLGLLVTRKKEKKHAAIILKLFSFIFVAYFLIVNRQIILEATDVKKLDDLYQHSQYVMGQGSPEVVGDDLVYSLAGYNYVTGGDPTSINFEHPPLGKMIFGGFIRLTERARLASVALYIAVVWVFYLMAETLLQSRLQALVAVGLLVVEQAILYLTTTTLIDLPLLLFQLTAVLFYYKRRYLLTGLMIGLALGSKIYFPTLILSFLMVVDVLFNRREDAKKLILSLLVSPLPLLLSYLVYFKTHSVVEFIEFQKWVLSWFMGKTEATKGVIFQSLALGRFTSWWDLEPGKIVAIEHWNVAWPIYLFTLVVNGFHSLRTKSFNLVIFWPIVYLIFLSFGAAAENLLIILLPFLIINFMLTLKLVK